MADVFYGKDRMQESVLDDSCAIEYFGSAVRYYRPLEKFEVDGIVYDPNTYESRGNIRRSMVDLRNDG